MSVEEDTELRDLVSQTLETNGCLAKIRAQLRASIFLALDEDEYLQKQEPLLNKKVKEHLETQQGKVMFCIVREFLEFFNLDFTISVYEPESYLGLQYNYGGRNKIIKDLGMPQLEEESTVPLLLQLIQIAQRRCNTETASVDSEKLQDMIFAQGSNENRLKVNKASSEKCDEIDDSKVHSDNSIASISEPVDTEVSKVASKKSVAPKLNETFDVSPNVHNNRDVGHEKRTNDFDDVDTEVNKLNINVISLNLKSISTGNDDTLEKDDTFEGTSSIAEDSIKENVADEHLANFSKSDKTANSLNNDNGKSKTLTDQTSCDSEFSPPVVKDGKLSKFDVSFEKLKLSQKSDKLKAKNSLTSLSDLPPLPINKSRNNDMLLPSLYSKEFKEKCSPRDIDKMFDLNSLDNYEEDFMSGSEIDFVLKKTDPISSDNSNFNSLHESQESSKLSNGIEVGAKINCTYNKSGDADKSDVCENEDLDYSNRNNTNDNSFKFERNNSAASSITSEDFEFNSNLEEILNSS